MTEDAPKMPVSRICPVTHEECTKALPEFVTRMVVGHEARHVCAADCAERYAASLGLIVDGEHFVYEEGSRSRQVEYKIGAEKQSSEKSLSS